MTQYYFRITPDGDVLGTTNKQEHSPYFMLLDSNTAITLDGDKYRYNGHNQFATKIRS